jgi:5-methylcytosine-specific restriction protein A
MKQLADGGADTISNAVALCPNCHRRCHVSGDREEFSQKISTQMNRINIGG